MKINIQVRRFDLGEIKSATRTPQGFLMCPGFATRVGVFPYMNSDGSIRNELRHPDDVNDPESLKTLKFAPVTIEHPPEMVGPLNVHKYGKGHTSDRVEVNRDMIDTDLILQDQEAIDAVEKKGMRELSSGYTADVVEEKGVFNGSPYDCRQKNIRYNHVAIVKRGRAGPEVRLRLDSQDAAMQDADAPKPGANIFSQESSVNDGDVSEGGETKKVIILGREVDLPSDVAEAIQEYKDRFDEMRAKLSQLEESMGKVRKDEDVSQKGISPQVKVEQQTPDGRKAGGKTPPKPGSETGRQDDEMEDEDETGVIGGLKPNSKEGGGKALADGEEDEKEDDEPASEKGGGSSESDIDKLKKDMEEKQGKHDAEMEALKGKMDEIAASSMNQPEKKDGGTKMDSADVQKFARARGKLERQAEKLVPASISNRFDSMTDKEIYAAVIKFRHPKADLADKSRTYLQSRFDSITETLAEEGTKERQNAGKALLGLGGSRMDSEEKTTADPAQARAKMLREGREMYKQPLSASRK